jgi:hypothetical protein
MLNLQGYKGVMRRSAERNLRGIEGGQNIIATRTILMNRAPVLTLWRPVIAQRPGFDEDEALAYAKAGAGLNAQAKGRRPGIAEARQSLQALGIPPRGLPALRAIPARHPGGQEGLGCYES